MGCRCCGWTWDAAAAAGQGVLLLRLDMGCCCWLLLDSAAGCCWMLPPVVHVFY
jgi:hypothetical protein